jgi:hypothetical protein
MIITIEIEQMIAELKKHDSDKARDYINVLNRTLMEMRQQNNALKESMMLTSNSELEGLSLMKENRELKIQVDVLMRLVNSFEE